MYKASNFLLNQFKMTTRWFKEELFHPTCIIGAMRGYDLPPHFAIGLTELATYIVDGKRDSHADEKGSILGFSFNVLPRVEVCKPHLMRQFPDIEQYANSLSSAFLDEICNNAELADSWIKDVEKKFGSFVHVQKLTMAANEKQNNLCEATDTLFNIPSPELRIFSAFAGNNESLDPEDQNGSKVKPK